MLIIASIFNYLFFNFTSVRFGHEGWVVDTLDQI